MTRRHRRLTRCLVVAGVLVACAPLLAWPAGAATSASAPTAVEAWYRSPAVGGDQDPVCETPAGCPVAPAPPAPPYPEDTLHVGATSGRTESVTYIAFDTSALPTGATLTGGTATLPVAGSESGSLAADAAELRACLLTTAFEPASGAPVDEAPPPNCSVTAPATYVGEGETPHFEIDLAVFLDGWNAPGAVAGLVLTPGEDASGTWHVAFSGREREQEGAAPPMTATLAYETMQSDGEPDFGSSLFTDDSSSTSGDQETGFGAPSSSSPFSPGAQSAPPPAPTAPSVAQPAETGGSDQPAPDVAPDPAAEQPIAAPMVPASYPSYPVVWLLPLLLAFGGITMARTLTGDIEVLSAEETPDLFGRIWFAFFPDRQPSA